MKMDLKKFKEAYLELLPWERDELIEWLKTQEEFEIYGCDLEDVQFTIDDMSSRFSDDEMLKQCDNSSVVNYVFDNGLEDDVVDGYDSKQLADYISRACPDVMEHLALDLSDLRDAERDKIFDVAYDQGYRDAKNGKKNATQL